jgi:hypothetical protein
VQPHVSWGHSARLSPKRADFDAPALVHGACQLNRSMIKLISIFAASAIALSLGDMPRAADEPGAPTMQDQGSPPPAELSKQEQDYLAALKKCEACRT